MKIILGKHSSSNILYAFDLGEKSLPKFGDYAVVRNCRGFELVKVILSAFIEDKDQKLLTHDNGEITGKVIKVLTEKELAEIDDE